MTGQAIRPWGLTRMRPFPATTVLAAASVVLDPDTQTGIWIGEDGLPLPQLDRHRRSETSKETKTRTSSDGDSDQDHDQEGDTD
ncbi:MAG: putative ATP-grasp-modified RiPP [Streptomycetaceae bacterium]|nr:putative ATP-grasp-modified RiPP [Streptomycetaceae bacterium]